MLMPQQLRTIVRSCFAITLCLSLAACANNGSQPQSDQESRWQALGEPNCKTYFDGCNTCTRNPESGISACTKKECVDYETPRCLDDADKTLTDAVTGPRLLRFRCSGNNRFTLYFGEYLVADKRIALEDSQIMFVDAATRIAEVMTERATASGRKFVSGETTLWLNDERAIVNKGNNNYYNNCEAMQSD